MRIRNSNNGLKMVALGAVLFFASCSEDNTGDGGANANLTAAEVNTVFEAEALAGSADNVLGDAYMGARTASKSSIDDQCYTGTYSDTGYTITFNECDLGDGTIADGTISVTYSTDSESLAYSATYDNFSVGTVNINGTRTFEIVAEESGSYVFDITSDLEVTNEAGEVIDIDGTKTVTYGVDDAGNYSVTGSWSVEVDGDTYSVNVKEALIGNVSCTYLKDGLATLSKNGLSVDVDWGDGECDNVATLIYPNGTEEEFTLRDF